MTERNNIEALNAEIERLRDQISSQQRAVTIGDLSKDLDMLNLVFNMVSDSIVLVDTEGTILFANQKFCDEYGYDPAKGPVKLYDLTWSLRTYEEFQQKLSETRANGGRLTYNARFQEIVNGKKKIVVHMVSVVLGNFMGREVVCISLQDITELVEARDKAQASRYLLDVVLDNIPVYLFVKDVDNDLRYLYWNKAFAEHSNIPAVKVIGKTDFEIFPDFEDAQKFRKDDLEVISTQEPINRHETYLAADGTTRIVQTLKILVPREDMGPLLVGVSWDITNMQDIEQELVKERMRADQSERVRSAFLANMSHEIRTPLNAIVGFSSLLTQTDDIKKRKKYSEIINQNSDLLIQLINDILDLSKIEAGTLEYVRSEMDVNDLFSSAYEVHKDNTKPDVKLILDSENMVDKVIVNEDYNRLMQVLTNLITNAIKFTEKGEIHMGYRIKDGFIEAYVKDTGIGIDADKLGKVFERFVKLNNFIQGTGLGLAICKVIINDIGGKLWVESKKDLGSTFYFTIPYEQENKAKRNGLISADDLHEHEHNFHVNASSVQKTILIVEDIESNYLLLDALLADDYKLEWAKNGQEGVNMCRQINPYAVFMDIKMPEMNGLQATRLIRGFNQDVPIVALSAFAYNHDKEKAYEAGANYYLTKPVSKSELEEVLRKIAEN